MFIPIPIPIFIFIFIPFMPPILGIPQTGTMTGGNGGTGGIPFIGSMGFIAKGTGGTGIGALFTRGSDNRFDELDSTDEGRPIPGEFSGGRVLRVVRVGREESDDNLEGL